MAKPPAAQLSRPQLVELYHFLKLNRMVEERLANLYRQGKVVGGLYRSLGQEACSVGAAYALEPGDIFTPLIRNLGAIFVRGGQPRDVFCQYMAKAASPTRGRDLNIHFGASTGAFHEGFNLACVQKAPLVLVVENNKYAYSTPTTWQTANTRFVDRAKAYGCFGEPVDGNDVLAVYEATRRGVERARSGDGPTLIEADTMRMRGHAEHDDMSYVPRGLLEAWARRDPIALYEKRLLEGGHAVQSDLDAIVAMIDRQLDGDVAFAEASPFPEADSGLTGVYAAGAVRPPTPPLVVDWETWKGHS